MVRLTAVTKIYGHGVSRVEALHAVDLHLRPGEFVSVMGPSGSGKSTLLHLVGALDAPTSGTITIDGRDIGQLDDDALTLFRRRTVGLVFQFFNLLPTLDVRENVLLPVMLERRVTAGDRQRAERLLEQLGLGERMGHRIYHLSGGEMQRVAIARALVMEPRLVLADEPTGNLDSATGAAILRLLRALSAEQGATVVLVTHDPGAARTGDRIVSLRDGCIVGDDRAGSSPAAGDG